MPYYEVNHSHPLTDAQRQDLARAITTIHVQAFKTPSMFVNVRFVAEDLAQGNLFIGGARETKTSNSIISYVRTSPARTKTDFDAVATKIEAAWYDVVAPGSQGSQHPYLRQSPEVRLHAIGMLPIVTAREAGFTIPVAGEEAAWIREQMPVFKELAEHGEGGFVTLLGEIKAAAGDAD